MPDRKDYALSMVKGSFVVHRIVQSMPIKEGFALLMAEESVALLKDASSPCKKVVGVISMEVGNAVDILCVLAPQNKKDFAGDISITRK